MKEKSNNLPELTDAYKVKVCTKEGVPGLCTNGGQYYFYKTFNRVDEDNWKIEYTTSAEFYYNPCSALFQDYTDYRDEQYDYCNTNDVYDCISQYGVEEILYLDN